MSECVCVWGGGVGVLPAKTPKWYENLMILVITNAQIAKASRRLHPLHPIGHLSLPQNPDQRLAGLVKIICSQFPLKLECSMP